MQMGIYQALREINVLTKEYAAMPRREGRDELLVQLKLKEVGLRHMDASDHLYILLVMIGCTTFT